MFESTAQTLVNTVNCVGVMGKGIALEFRKRFPEMFDDYVSRCSRSEVGLGRPYIFRRPVPPWILNFPTKDHWRSLARVDDIVAGLEYVLRNYREWGITSLAVPPLGTGQGQLEWRIVGPILYRYLSHLDVPVDLYAPHGVIPDELELTFLKTGSHPRQLPLKAPALERINPAWTALVEILRRVETQPYHWPVGRTSFQKMAFIASQEGLPLGLVFRRGSYGPYSAELKPSLARLLNNGLIVERRSGSMFEVIVGPSFDTAYRAHAHEIKHWEPIIERVFDLFMRTNTRQAEIIATVLFAAKELSDKGQSTPTESRLLAEVVHWKQRRKPPLDPLEVATKIRDLAAMGWLEVEPSEDLLVLDEDFIPAPS
ncbi:MAG TPA: macro domain-containing protein [Anaerolineales bacterium]|nr:macro domain-containing protein [Anaerolineales bacterium]